MSLRRCDWLFPPSAREVSPGNRSNYKSTRERVGSKGFYGRWRLHLMGSCLEPIRARGIIVKDNGLLNGVVYIDLKKAFETIDHAILLRKLANYGLDLGSLRFQFTSCLGNRSQKCYVNGTLSSASELRCRVRQGTTLGEFWVLCFS